MCNNTEALSSPQALVLCGIIEKITKLISDHSLDYQKCLTGLKERIDSLPHTSKEQLHICGSDTLRILRLYGPTTGIKQDPWVKEIDKIIIEKLIPFITANR